MGAELSGRDELIERAEAGDVDAMLQLGSLSDLAERARWFLRAAQAESEEGAGRLLLIRPELESRAREGDVECQNVLGGILLAWDDDPAAAAGWFRKAAAAANNEARRSLGYLLIEGSGVQKDVRAAEELFRLAASEGDAVAGYNLAVLLLDEDEAGEADLEAVLPLLRSAVEAGIDEAAARLGDICEAGGDERAAFRWYETAAESGHIAAMFAVGCRYRDGIGVDVDRVQAVRWFLGMLDLPSFDGVHEIFSLTPSLTADEIRLGGRLAGREDEAEKIIEMRDSSG